MHTSITKEFTSQMVLQLPPITVYVDMDGTLAEYKCVDVKMLYEPMYFLNLNPNENVIKGMKIFMSNHPEINVQVLSCILEDRPNAIEEKTAWIERHCPFLLKSAPCFIPCGTNKSVITKDSGISVLLDDYSPNLIEFRKKCNCLGIKLLNGINGEGRKWQGPIISKDLLPEEFAKRIYKIIMEEINANILGNCKRSRTC